MWKCYENNVRLVYLPPHTSHVLQPLDLAIFSRIKSSYRAQIEALARFEDSAPVKKIRFVEYYNQAREYALNEIYIKAEWRAAGLFPWAPKKVLNSKQIQSNMLPPQTPRKRQYSSSSILNTPQNKRQLIEAQTALLQEENLTRSVRVLFNKTAKAFGQLHVEKAQNLQ